MTFKELNSLPEYQKKLISFDSDFVNVMFYLVVTHSTLEETILFDIIKEHITQ